MTPQQSDWLSRVNLPDVYPRKADPFRPPAGSIPSGAPSQGSESSVTVDVYTDQITIPGQRPVVYQQALNFSIGLAAGIASPLTNGSFQCDTIVLDVYATAANSVFFGYGSGITVNTGLEIRPGLPVSISPENTREQWELQRVLEALLAIQAADRGLSTLGQYRAPRTVFDSSKYFVVAAVATNISVMLFTVPEFQ